MDPVRFDDLKSARASISGWACRGRTPMGAIARIVPYDAEPRPLTIRSRRPGAPLLARVVLPPALRLKVDIVALLAEERQHER